MKKVAIISPKGLGDALLMMIVAYQMHLSTYQTCLFHDEFKQLSPLFKNVPIFPHPPLESLEKVYQDFDKVIIQNDHSSRAYALAKLRQVGKLTGGTFFFPTPSPLFQKGDFLFDPKLPVATNLCIGCQTTFALKNVTKKNGIVLPEKGVYRRHPKRVVIHPTSSDRIRNWLPAQFLLLAQKLKAQGYQVGFAMSAKERCEWPDVKRQGFHLPKIVDLHELSTYLYESGFFIGNDSGIGHLASNLGIPTLTISGNPKRVRCWRPDWAEGQIATLPFSLPNFKGIGLRVRDHLWQRFVSVSRVLKAFHKLEHAL